MLSYRPISKIVARLAKKYGFDDSVTPNYKFTKTCSYLHYLYREYEKLRINLASFRELVRVHAYDYALQADFVSYLAAAAAYGPNESEAVYWYQEFKLLPEDCPHEIKNLISENAQQRLAQQQQEQHPGGVAEHDTTEAQACEMYLSMDLPDECLIIVDTAANFERMLKHLQHEQVIYMDSEWMQNVCAQNQLCLLQIATTHNVYLIDCLASQELQEKHWRALGANVFNNANILKVGFSMLNDLSVLQRSLPLQLRLQMPHHYLDLRTVWLELKRQRNGIELPFGNVSRAGEALSDLSMLCLGKKLNKANQCSNWANRPLRREQILYAGELTMRKGCVIPILTAFFSLAMDARCLLLIYSCLSSCVPDINVIIEKSIASNNFLKRGSSNVK